MEGGAGGCGGGLAGGLEVGGGGVGPVVGVGPGERHVANAETVVVPEEGDRVFNGVAAFDAHEDGEFSSAVGFDDLVGGGAELELVGGFTDLLERAVDEFQGA